MKKTAILFSAVFLLGCNGFFMQQAVAAKTRKEAQIITKSGTQPFVRGSMDFFTGTVRVDTLFSEKDDAPFSGAYVTFEAGARSAWHIHPAGQHLIVVSGVGLTQEWGGAITEIKEGDVIWCPPGIKHWHGASPDTAMKHMALTGTFEGKNVQWLEKVSDEQYGNIKK